MSASEFLPEKPPWTEEAACRGVDPDIFFPKGNKKAALEQTEAAKAICQTCVVIVTCRKYAIDNDEKGIWGGMTEQERDQEWFTGPLPRRQAS